MSRETFSLLGAFATFLAGLGLAGGSVPVSTVERFTDPTTLTPSLLRRAIRPCFSVWAFTVGKLVSRYSNRSLSSCLLTRPLVSHSWGIFRHKSLATRSDSSFRRQFSMATEAAIRRCSTGLLSAVIFTTVILLQSARRLVVPIYSDEAVSLASSNFAR